MKQLQLVVLAALLHDIGKFAQRAGAPKSADQVDMYCPVDQKSGCASHLHVLYTDYFIEQVLLLPDQLEPERSRLARLAASHHKPAADDRIEQALKYADGLSAGSDRKQGEEAEGNYKSARLLSIFEQVSLDGERKFEELSKGRYHKLQVLSAADDPGPLKEAQKTGYRELYSGFCEALNDLPLDLGVSTFIDAVASLLEEYIWCIPSSTYRSLPDISLYDHATTTAALTQVLLRFAEKTDVEPGQQADTAAKFLLVGGDLSGIQNYIFGLDRSHGSGVAKLFRARSFYLQALTRGVILALCERLGLSPLARVMDAGGRFLLLVPALDEVREQLAVFELELQREMFNRFSGRLSLNLDWSVALCERDLHMSHLRDHLDRANDALEARKLRKFDRLFASGQSALMELDFAAYEDGDCSVCHSHPVDAEASRKQQRESGREVKLCAECADQIRLLGTPLPTCNYLVFEKQAEREGIALLFGYQLRLVKSLQPDRDGRAAELVSYRQRGLCAYQPIAAHLPQISDADIELWKHCNELQVSDGQLYSGEDRVEVGAPKTFEMLARCSRRLDPDHRLVGRSFLGAFKADVDNLGLVFSVGLQNRLSLSRFASLSRMLNHFFSEELVRWISSEWKNIYVVFAGGDDLFLLGPWTDLVAFAPQLNERFSAWAAECPDLTLSAGLTVHRPGLPVHGIADVAEEALEQSKGFNKGEQSKNAVTLFEVTRDWEGFGQLKEQGERILEWLDEEIIPRGLAARLLKYGKMHNEFMAGKVEKGLYKSHMRYDFARNLKENKLPDEAARAEILGMQLNDDLLRDIRLPVSYALYQTRFDH
jgi:CRISPR-associated protein Csm1